MVLRGSPWESKGAADRWTALALFRRAGRGAHRSPSLHMEVLSMSYTVFVIGNIASRSILTVVEVSAAASFTDAFGLADDVLAVHAPLDIRRARALERG